MLNTALAGLTLSISSHAFAEPQGGSVTGGTAVISNAPNITTITQSTDRSIIKWNSFDLNSAETVRFIQPSSSSITLNRIYDTKASSIDGKIEANGNVMLLNPNGIVFGQNARIDVTGIIATTSQIDDNIFMSGNQVLNLTPGGNPNASVINNGQITAKEAGLVGLVASTVENNGVIQARLGKVTLAGAERVTLDLAGDDFITVDVTDQINGKVLNAGNITADGGTITLTAARARNAVETSIVNTGKLQANSIGTKNGRIILSAGGITETYVSVKPAPAEPVPTPIAPAVKNSGTILAQGDDLFEDGGMIDLLGDSIELDETSVIDASAFADAGTIHIGGDYQGQGERPRAEWVEVADGSVTSANSLFSGNGGSVILWADRLMYYRGRIEAEAEGEEGNGGFVEVSGKNILNFDGDVSTLSKNGENGILLLDPTNITISSAAHSNVNASTPFSPTADNVTSVLNIDTLHAALASGSVTIQTRATGSQLGDITVDAAINHTSNNNLTLTAAHDIIINSVYTSTGAGSSSSDVFNVGNDLKLNAAVTAAKRLTINATAGQSVAVGSGQTGALTLTTTELAFINGSMVSGFTIATTGAGDINVGASTWTGSSTTLSTVTGTININGAVSMRGTTLSSASGAINIGAAMTMTGSLAVSTPSLITVGSTISMGNNALSFTTDSNIAINANISGTNSFTLLTTSAGTTMGIGDSQSGTVSLTDAELNRIQNGFTSRVFGATTNTGAINIGAYTWVDPLTIATMGQLNINGNQTMGANALTLRTDSDILLDGQLSSTGAFTFSSISGSKTLGIGSGQTGDITFSDTDLDKILGGFSSLNFTTVNSALNVGAYTWQDNLSLTTAGGALNINGVQALDGNTLNLSSAAGVINIDANISGITNMAVSTAANIVLGGTLSGTGTLAFNSSTTGTSFGIGSNEAGTIEFTDTELDNILDGWTSLTFSGATAAINVGSYNWKDNLILNTSNAAGVINFNGAQIMGGNNLSATSTTGTGLITIGAAISGANNLTLTTASDLAINAAISGTGILTIAPQATTTSVAIGTNQIGAVTGQTGQIALDDAELAQIQNGWSSIIVGSTTSVVAMNVGAMTWLDDVTLQNGTAALNVNGINNFTATSAIRTTSGTIALNSANVFTGASTIQATTTNGTITIGDGNTWNGTSSIIQTTTSATGIITIGNGNTWNNTSNIQTTAGAININGANNWVGNSSIISTTGGISLIGGGAWAGTSSIQSSTGALNIGAGNTWTGASTITATSTGAITVGANNTFNNTALIQSAGGIINLNGANNWNGDSSIIGTSGALNINAANTWNSNTTWQTTTGLINVNAAQDLGGNNLNINTNANPTFSAPIYGRGSLSVAATSGNVSMAIGIGALQVGTIAIDNSDLAYLVNGWKDILFSTSVGTGAMNIGAYNWQYDVTFRTAAGLLSVNGNQNTNGNMTFETNSTFALNADLSGTGILGFRTNNIGTTMNIGGANVADYLTLTELAKIQNGWQKLVFGRSDMTGALGIWGGSYLDNTQFTTGSGLLSVNSNINLGSNDLNLTTNSLLTLTGNVTGTGNLVIEGSSAATGIGIGSTIGAIQITATELGKITNGWNSVTYGNSTMTGQITLGANNFGTNATTFVTRGNIVLNGSQTSTKAAATSLTFVTLAGSFINSSASYAITPGAGSRYLIYSVAAANDTYASLSIPTTVTQKTYYSYAPSSVTEIGNVAIYNGGAAKVIYLQVDNKNKVYGDVNPYFTYTYLGGLEGTDLLTSSLLTANFSASSSLTDNVGTTSAITGNYTTANGYTVQEISGVMTVTKAPVLVSPSNVTREYGEANPAITASYLGLRNNETHSVIDTLATVNNGATATTDAGTVIITVSDAMDNNYIFNYNAGTMTITKAQLTATASSATREYGELNPAFTVAYSGFKNGETASVIDTGATASSSATATTNVGSASVIASGASDNNYDFSYVNGALTITKAQLTATASSATREYGELNPAFTVAYSGFKNGETASVIDTGATASSSATATTNVGSASVIASGASDNNYDFSYVNGALTITKAQLTATASSATREYGELNPAFTVAYSGFKNGETASVIDTGATASSSATATTNVGSASVIASGASDNNYDFSYVNGALTITKAQLTATASSATREYGELNPAFTVAYSGFKNGETASVIDTGATASSSATATTNVGSASVIASGASDNNYDFSYVNGALTITKAQLTATASSATREYGELNPAFTVAYSGFKNGETASVIDTGATASSSATATTNVGSASVIASGASDNNYDFSYVNGALTITKAQLTATASSATREYGELNPAFTVAYSGFKNGETASVIDTGATASSSATATTNVGSASVIASGASDNNYDFSYVNGALTITKAQLTATASSATREYGELNPAFTVAYSGFKNGETASVIDTGATASSSATATTNVGSASVIASGASDNNYDFSYVNGALTITKALAIIEADDKTKIQGSVNPALTYSVSGLKNNENSNVVSGINLMTNATINSLAGNYLIQVSGGSATNYDFNLIDGNLQITSSGLPPTSPPEPQVPPSAAPITVIPDSYQAVLSSPASQGTNITLFTGPTSANFQNMKSATIADENRLDDYIKIEYNEDPFSYKAPVSLMLIDPQIYEYKNELKISYVKETSYPQSFPDIFSSERFAQR